MVNDTYSDIISNAGGIYKYTIHLRNPHFTAPVRSPVRTPRFSSQNKPTMHEQTPPRLPRHTRPCHSQTHPAPASERGAVALTETDKQTNRRTEPMHKGALKPAAPQQSRSKTSVADHIQPRRLINFFSLIHREPKNMQFYSYRHIFGKCCPIFTARSVCNAQRALGRRKMSVRPSVCHIPVFCQKG